MAIRPRIRVTRFFDVSSLTSRWERRYAWAMKRIGGKIRWAAMDLPGMKHVTKGTSAPGQPPHRHHKRTRGSLRQIEYDYDPKTKSVVVGPIFFKRGDTPHLIEFGGTRVVTRKRSAARKLQYRARPFMGAALKEARKSGVISSEFRNILTR